MAFTNNIIVWRRVAQISGIFAFVICMLLIVNYIQYNRIDPVETEAINALIIRLNENPDDTALRESVREIDLLSRKAYFTNRWQVRTGGYLLLLSIGVMLTSVLIIKSNSEKEITITENQSYFTENKVSQKWITITGSLIVLVALVSAWLTHESLGKLPVLESKITEMVEQPTVDIKPEQAEPSIEETSVDTVDNLGVDISEKEKEETKIIAIEEKAEVLPEKLIPSASEEVKKAVANKKSYPDFDEIVANFGTFRGPFGDGISYHKNIPENWNGETNENILWKTKIPLHGYNSPIIWGDKVFLTGANPQKREVYCIDSKDGSIIWTYNVTGIAGSPPQSPKTTDDTGLAAPTATTDGTGVFAIFGNGDLVALDMDGKKLWDRNMGDPDNHYGYSSSLLLYKDILIVQYDTKKAQRILGFDKRTGQEIWETPRKVKISWASPVIINYTDKPEVILTADPGVQSYDPDTGKELWTIDCVYGEVGPSVGYDNGIVFATNEYATLAAIRIGEPPEIIWETDYYLSDVPSPVASNGLLFLATSYGAVVCHDANTGDMYWEHEFDNGFYSSPVLVDGKIYLMDMDGIMHIFKADKEYIPIADNPLGENAMTTPAFKDGKIFIRGNDNLYCITY